MRDDEGPWRPVPRGLLGGVVLAWSVGGCAASETEPPSPPRAETSDASTQADALVQLYAVQRAPIACHRRAVALGQHNDTARVRAWRLVCAEHRLEDGRAMREAARWRATEPDSVWAAFAALGTEQAHEKLGPAAIEKARATWPEVPEINGLIDYVAGRIALHEGDTHQAEVRLIEAHRRRPIGRPELPTKRWIETVYTQVHGSRRGLERYWSKLEVRSKELRKRAILASRETEPNSLPTFELTDRAGRVRSSADFEGKVGIIHFWGPWCGWCVKELDDYASLAHRYADDSKVVVLSLVSDTLPDELEAFMREHDYGFATALDGGQPERWGIRSYPTTWFINPRGEIEFVASGMTPHLEEEFQWRIEALRK